MKKNSAKYFFEAFKLEDGEDLCQKCKHFDPSYLTMCEANMFAGVMGVKVNVAACTEFEPKE
jgi:hypothetical protein